MTKNQKDTAKLLNDVYPHLVSLDFSHCQTVEGIFTHLIMTRQIRIMADEWSENEEAVFNTLCHEFSKLLEIFEDLKQRKSVAPSTSTLRFASIEKVRNQLIKQ